MRDYLHQRSVTTLYINNGKVFSFSNAYHYRVELKLKLLNFEKFKKMR